MRTKSSSASTVTARLAVSVPPSHAPRCVSVRRSRAPRRLSGGASSPGRAPRHAGRSRLRRRRPPGRPRDASRRHDQTPAVRSLRATPPRWSRSVPGSRRTARCHGSRGTGRGRRRGRAPPPARPRRRGTSRSRPGRRAHPVPATSPVITWRTGPNEAAVTTTSASWTADARVGGEHDLADPLRLPRGDGKGLSSLQVAIEQESTRRPAARDPAPPGGCGPGHRRR